MTLDRDAKLLEWYDPTMSRDIERLNLPHYNSRQQSQQQQQQSAIKLYDRLIFKKSGILFRPIPGISGRRPWETFEEEENGFPLGAPLEFYMNLNDPDQLKAKFIADLSPGTPITI